MALRTLSAVGLVLGAACAQPSADPTTFTAGEDGDPIVKQVRAELNGSETITLTFSNRTSYDFSPGVITFAPLYTVNTVPSTPLFNYVKGGLPTSDRNDTLLTALGLVAGTTAFLVPEVRSGRSTTVTITVPAGQRINYLARIRGSTDDFVAATNVPISSGVPGTPIPFQLQGYDLSTTNNRAGLTKLGNDTIGANPSNTTVTVTTAGDCPAGPTVVSSRWLSDDFSAGANDSAWPRNAGWDGDFNGDWYTDGVTARLWNPNWGGAEPGAPVPTTTGFWKLFDVCPAAGAKVSVVSKITSNFTAPLSDSTLVVYFFDRGGALLSVITNHPIRDDNDRRVALYDAAIPASTRRIAVAPMMFLAPTEQGAVFFDDLTIDYETADQFTTTAIAADGFSSAGASSFGNNQPTGWAEFGGDWYAMTANQWATVWNPAFAGGAANLDTGLVKAFSLGGFKAGDVLNARLFAAATFSDKRSFVRVLVIFNDAAKTTVESDRQVRGYGEITVRRTPIPATATSAQVVINAFLGPTEASSLYVDDFKIERQRPK
jgi:hypothetical protein